MNRPEDILEDYKSGAIDRETAVSRLYESRSTNLLHTRIDHDRQHRTGAPEVIYGAGKTAGQITAIAAEMRKHGSNILITRIAPESVECILKEHPEGRYHPEANIVTITETKPEPTEDFIAVVSAGTSDQAIAEEAALTAEFLGSRVERFYDCGVAGLHRLLDVLEDIRKARVIIAVAGMEGALPSVLAGLVKVPVIAVPTSVGYGMNLQGVSTLLAMMNSCANGVSVVNIDNGFGAGYNAHIINML